MTRIVRIALVVYLSPVLLATFAVGLIAVVIFHLAILTTTFFTPHQRATNHRPSAVMSPRISRGRTDPPRLA